MVDHPILVTGASGNVGSEIVKILLAQKFSVRAPSRAEFDLEKPPTFSETFKNVERMFLMRPPAIADAAKLAPALTHAKLAGVKHIVFLSLLGAEKNRIVPHRKIEDRIRSMGFTFTFLRPSFFMQNLSSTHAKDIREKREIIVPAGTGLTSFIDVRDIAAVGAKALTEPGHENQCYALTGNAALSYTQVAKILSQELGVEIGYRNPSIFTFSRAMRAQHHSWPFIAVMAAIYTVAKLGKAGLLTNEVKRLLGREPISFETFAHDYRASWLPAANHA